ncbi:hypothetical protein ACFSTD_06560 [Novosphingobium colocasiae]
MTRSPRAARSLVLSLPLLFVLPAATAEARAKPVASAPSKAQAPASSGGASAVALQGQRRAAGSGVDLRPAAERAALCGAAQRGAAGAGIDPGAGRCRVAL